MGLPTQGLFDSRFPWARFSAIHDQASDLWYGFQVLLVPFSRPDNLLHGLLAGGIALTGAALVLLWVAFRRLQVEWPLAWVVAFAAASGDVPFRLTMLRPQPLSLALAVLALSLLAAPGARHRRLGLLLAPLALDRYRTRVAGARPLLAFRGAALWLAANAPPGELVFHAWWDQFPHLFFWNPRSHYVNGMDPLFLYAHDPRLFWKAHLLAIDAEPETTCGRPACGPGEAEATPLVLRRDFGASFVVLHRTMNPRLTAYLAAVPGFLRVFDDGTDVVFRVLPQPRSP